MNDAYVCMMHHPHGFFWFIVGTFCALIGIMSFMALGLFFVDKIFRKPIHVPTFRPIPEFNDG